MFAQSFKITGAGMSQIFLLGDIGYFLFKKNILGQEGLNALSRLVIEITLPVLIFCQLIKDFSFSLYPDWWLPPLLSIIIIGAGLGLGMLFLGSIKGQQHKLQFLSLVAFQNSGYLPLALIAALLPPEQANCVFIYLFLFLLGFNLLMWSLGVYILTFTRTKKFELGSFFSPPVIATILSLGLIALGWQKFAPDLILKPLRLVGDCTLPLAMFVVGGNLAQIHLGHIDKRAIFLVTLLKLILLPLLGLAVVLKFNIAQLLGFLMVMQLAMPPATSLSVITSHYKKEDLLISQGIFFGHILSILTIPVFLSLYFMLVMLK